jgi:hypothetical protein
LTSGASEAASSRAAPEARTGTGRPARSVPANGDSPAPHGQPPSPAVSTAVVLATTTAAGGGPAAALSWHNSTVLRRVLDQLTGLGIAGLHVVTRPGWEPAIRPSLVGLEDSVRLHVSDSVSDDLRTVARAAGQTDASIVVLHGDIITHREALAGLLGDPRVTTGVLTRHGGFPPYLAPRTRSSRARVVSASSPYHYTGRPNTTLLGVIKVGARDRDALAGAAERLAALTEPPIPPGWDEELERKAARWRLGLAHGGAVEAGEAPVDGD